MMIQYEYNPTTINVLERFEQACEHCQEVSLLELSVMPTEWLTNNGIKNFCMLTGRDKMLRIHKTSNDNPPGRYAVFVIQKVKDSAFALVHHVWFLLSLTRRRARY